MSNLKNKTTESTGRFAYDGLERVIHEKARLGIVTSLATHPEGLLFNDLKELCSLTDGNLSRHLQILHEAGLVEVWKGYHGNRPQTLVRLTPDGRKRFVEYIAVLESVVTDALKAPRSRRGRPTPMVTEGLVAGVNFCAKMPFFRWRPTVPWRRVRVREPPVRPHVARCGTRTEGVPICRSSKPKSWACASACAMP